MNWKSIFQTALLPLLSEAACSNLNWASAAVPDMGVVGLANLSHLALPSLNVSSNGAPTCPVSLAWEANPETQAGLTYVRDPATEDSDMRIHFQGWGVSHQVQQITAFVKDCHGTICRQTTAVVYCSSSGNPTNPCDQGKVAAFLSIVGCKTNQTLASSGLYYLNYPDAQTFQIGSPSQGASCTYDLALQADIGTINYTELSFLTMITSTGAATFSYPPPEQNLSPPFALVSKSTTFALKICKYEWTTSGAQTSVIVDKKNSYTEFTLPKYKPTTDSDPGCPTTTNYSIASLTRNTHYSDKPTNTAQSDVQTVLFVGSTLSVGPSQTRIFEATVPGKASKGAYPFTMEVTDTTCQGGDYDQTQKDNFNSDYPQPQVYVLHSQMQVNFAFPIHSKVDVNCNQFKLTFGTTTGVSTLPAISVTPQRDQNKIMVLFNMANDANNLNTYAGHAKDLIMEHGSGKISTKVTFCKLQTPATFTDPIPFNQKDQTADSAYFALPSFLPADLQTECLGKYTYEVASVYGDKISVQTSGTVVNLVVKVKTMAHGTYPFTYRVYYKDPISEIKYEVQTKNLNVWVIGECSSGDAVTNAEQTVTVFLNGPHATTSIDYETIQYLSTVCARPVDKFEYTCTGGNTASSQTNNNSSPEVVILNTRLLASQTNECDLITVLTGSSSISLKQADILTVYNQQQSYGPLRVGIKGWSEFYGKKPTTDQRTITVNFSLCPQPSFSWLAPAYTSFNHDVVLPKSYTGSLPNSLLSSTEEAQCTDGSASYILVFGPELKQASSDAVLGKTLKLEARPSTFTLTINKVLLEDLLLFDETPGLPVDITFKVQVKHGPLAQTESEAFKVNFSSNACASEDAVGQGSVLEKVYLDELKSPTSFTFQAFKYPTSGKTPDTYSIACNALTSKQQPCTQDYKHGAWTAYSSLVAVSGPDVCDCELIAFDSAAQKFTLTDPKMAQKYEPNRKITLEMKGWNKLYGGFEPQKPQLTLTIEVFKAAPRVESSNATATANTTAVRNNTAPFLATLEKTTLFEVPAGIASVVDLGLVKDREDDSVVVQDFKVFETEMRPLISLTNSTFEKRVELAIHVNATLLKGGEMASLRLTISDDYASGPLATVYWLKVAILPSRAADEQDLVNATVDNMTQIAKPTPEPGPTSTFDPSTLITVDTPESKQEEAVLAQNLPQSQDQKPSKDHVKVNVSLPDITGVMKMSFSRKIRLPANFKEWTSENEGKEKLQIEYLPTIETLHALNDTAHFFKWKVVSNSARNASRSLASETNLDKMNVKLEFAEVYSVSADFQELDRIQLKVLPAFFDQEPQIKSYGTELEGDNKEKNMIELKVPRQIRDENAFVELLRGAVETTQVCLIAIGSTNLILSIFLSGLLQHLWGMINVLQLIMHTALFAILLPSNAQTFMFSLLQMSNLDIFNVEQIHQQLFQFESLAPYNAVFELAGYQTTNFIIESGTLLFAVTAFPIVLLLKKLLTRGVKACCKQGNCLTRYLEKEHPVNVQVVRFFLEGCFGLGLAAAIQIFVWQSWQFKSLQESISLTLAIVQLSILIGISIYLGVAAHKVFHKTADKAKYEELFEGLMPKRRCPLAFPSIFLLRRIVTILVLTLGTFYKNFQVFAYLALSWTSLLYLIMVKPFDTKLVRFTELANELAILTLSYFLFLFTDYVTDPELEFSIGWTVIVLIIGVILLNMVVFGIALVLQIRLSCKRWQNRRNHAALMKEVAERRASQKLLIEVKGKTTTPFAHVKNTRVTVEDKSPLSEGLKVIKEKSESQHQPNQGSDKAKAEHKERKSDNLQIAVANLNPPDFGSPVESFNATLVPILQKDILLALGNVDVLRSYDHDFKATVVQRPAMPSLGEIMKQNLATMEYSIQQSGYEMKKPHPSANDPLKSQRQTPQFQQPKERRTDVFAGSRHLTDIANVGAAQLNLQQSPSLSPFSTDFGATLSPTQQRQRFRMHLP